MDVYWMFLLLCLASVLALALGLFAVKLFQDGIAATQKISG